MMEVVELSCPHLVLANARGDDGLAFGQAAEFLDDLLGHDSARDRFVGEGIFFPPGVDLLPPLLESFGEVGVGAARQDLIEIFQGKPHIGKDGKVDDLIFIELGCIHIDVNDGGFFCELRNFSGDTIVKANSKSEE